MRRCPQCDDPLVVNPQYSAGPVGVAGYFHRVCFGCGYIEPQKYETAAEAEQEDIQEDSQFWSRIASVLNVHLIGFTLKSEASFSDPYFCLPGDVAQRILDLADANRPEEVE